METRPPVKRGKLCAHPQNQKLSREETTDPTDEHEFPLLGRVYIGAEKMQTKISAIL
jgi:hypothetical protein